MKSKPENLLSDEELLLKAKAGADVFITFPELRKRWGGLHPTNAKNILTKLGIKTYRLTNKTVLFKLAEVVAAEEASRDNLPSVNNLPKQRAAKKQKELTAK